MVDKTDGVGGKKDHGKLTRLAEGSRRDRWKRLDAVVMVLRV